MTTRQSLIEGGGAKVQQQAVGGACGDCQSEVGGAWQPKVGGASGDWQRDEYQVGDGDLSHGGTCAASNTLTSSPTEHTSLLHQRQNTSNRRTYGVNPLSQVHQPPVGSGYQNFGLNQSTDTSNQQQTVSSGYQNFENQRIPENTQPGTETTIDACVHDQGRSSNCINCPEIFCPSTAQGRMNLKEWLSEISIPVYVLIMFFAIASWVDINGLWVQVPLLVNALPEGWNLPSYLVIIIQVANIGPFIYTIANRLAPRHVKEWPVVYIIIAVGAVSCVLLGFFWDVTTVIGGNEHSTALLSLSMSLALVDCTSSVVFLPYMSIFRPQYMTAYYIGEGLSGLVPGLVGLAQGVGGDPVCVNTSRVIHNETTGENYTIWEVVAEYKDPNFSVDVFFFFLCALICTSGICFTFLNFAPFCQKETILNVYSYDIKPDEYVAPVDEEEQHPSERFDKLELETSGGNPRIETSNIHLTNSTAVSSSRDDDGRDRSKPHLSRNQLACLLVITAWVNGLTNGVLPSTQSYSALPYGNLAYNLSVRLGTVANPLACFLALFMPTSSVTTVVILTGVGTVLSAYQLVLAAMSPVPPMQGELVGEFLCVSTSIFLYFCF